MQQLDVAFTRFSDSIIGVQSVTASALWVCLLHKMMQAELDKAEGVMPGDEC